MPRKFDRSRLSEHQELFLLAAYAGVNPVDGCEDKTEQGRLQTTALSLRRRGFIEADEVTLTPTGRELAEALRRDKDACP